MDAGKRQAEAIELGTCRAQLSSSLRWSTPDHLPRTGGTRRRCREAVDARLPTTDRYAARAADPPSTGHRVDILRGLIAYTSVIDLHHGRRRRLAVLESSGNWC